MIIILFNKYKIKSDKRKNTSAGYNTNESSVEVISRIASYDAGGHCGRGRLWRHDVPSRTPYAAAGTSMSKSGL